MWIDFRVVDVDVANRTLLIEQLINEPDDIRVNERIPVRKDALIVFSEHLYTGKESRQIERAGHLGQIKPGQDGGLILDKQGQARYILVSAGATIILPSKPENQR